MPPWTRFLRPKSNAHSAPVEDDSPPNDLGLTVVVDPGAERNIDLIFIHGLGGTSQSTWAHDGKSGCFWPKEWLPKERGMETARIMVWGYHAPSNPFSAGTTMSISRFASDLLNALVVNDAGRIHPIVFVCHSMGGLIAKQAVISGSVDPQFRHIINKVKGVVFFATPHRGSNLAKTAASIDRMVRASQLGNRRRYIKELTPESNRIEDINRDFRHHLHRLFVLSFYEECPSSSIGDVVVVPLASAVLDSPGETSCGIHADHMSICKYASPDCPQYRVAASNISRFIQIINLLSSPDSSPAALDALALFLYGDELGVKQARAAVLEKARGVVGSIIGRDHESLEPISKGKAAIWWHEQLMEGVESLNLPADMRTSFDAQNLRNRSEIMGLAVSGVYSS